MDKAKIKYLIARNRMLYSRNEADADTDEFAKFVNEYLRSKGYNDVNVEYVDEYPQGNADEQAALRDEIESAYKLRKPGNPTEKYAR